MTTFTYTYAPTVEVLKNGGEMPFKVLADKLMAQDPRRFRVEKTVETAIDRYAHCLTSDGAVVRFNKNSDRYARFSIMERDIQSALHGAIENMEEFQLYPFKTRKNSDSCYLNIPWSEIPKDPHEEEHNMHYPDGCDFRGNGEDSCRVGCRVSENVLRKHSLAQS